jgi:hypothetical protein
MEEKAHDSSIRRRASAPFAKLASFRSACLANFGTRKPLATLWFYSILQLAGDPLPG